MSIISIHVFIFDKDIVGLNFCFSNKNKSWTGKNSFSESEEKSSNKSIKDDSPHSNMSNSSINSFNLGSWFSIFFKKDKECLLSTVVFLNLKIGYYLLINYFH